MSSEKVASFISFLDGEVKSQWDERSMLRGKGNDELAYHCKMKASQTELIRAVFMNILKDETTASSERDEIKKVFGNSCEILEPGEDRTE